jgi:omega-3 fatty acid desaturase (delta-15 desaturase)
VYLGKTAVQSKTAKSAQLLSLCISSWTWLRSQPFALPVICRPPPAGWRISHRKHHGNHGHVENDESWHPTTKSQVDEMEPMGRLGRLKFPWPLFAYPFYLWFRSPGKQGSHYDPNCDLFQPSEKRMVLTSDAFMLGMVGVLAACTAKLGFLSMLNLYVLPYW